jgi:small-conductance mechanosensitive channel
MNIEEFLEYKIFEVGEYSMTVYKLVLLALIYLATKLIGWFIKKALIRHRQFNKLDQGSEYAILAIFKYLIGIVAIIFALEIIGVQITILIAGSAALLVGVGLGLQQTFNDIVSGIILLLEGNTKVGDILQVDDMVVQLEHIGLRTSKVLNRDDIIVIIPNSLIVTNKVINWSHQINHTRFRVSVGVAYGSDVDLVMKLLEDSARENKFCSKVKPPQARFLNFGDSSLDFEVVFWSTEMFRIEKVLSDIRRAIDRKFRENGVSIPFPQRDLHLKSSNINLH